MALAKNQKEKIASIAKKRGLDLVLLFGSQASGKTHFASDFDVAVLSKKPIPLEKELEIQCEFVKIFKTDNVDMVDIRKASPLLMQQIFDNHKILFCRDLIEYYRYGIYAMRSYAEAKPLFELKERSIESFLKKHA